MSPRTSRGLGCLAVPLVMALTGGVLALAWARQQHYLDPLPFEQRCVAVAAEKSRVTLSTEQAYLAAVIAGTGVGHGAGEHGATIAAATAYQESGIRNLDHGDRDSIGLFQQRPSQDWGTPAQIMDPWYASGRFYDRLMKVPGWQSGDVNDTAQAVQRSGHPQAYRRHEANARVLAQVFTGSVPAGLSCFDERVARPDPAGYLDELQRTFGPLAARPDGARVTIATQSARMSWAVAAYTVAHASSLGIEEVSTEGRSWRASQNSLPAWTEAAGPAQEVQVTFRSA